MENLYLNDAVEPSDPPKDLLRVDRRDGRSSYPDFRDWVTRLTNFCAGLPPILCEVHIKDGLIPKCLGALALIMIRRRQQQLQEHPVSIVSSGCPAFFRTANDGPTVGRAHVPQPNFTAALGHDHFKNRQLVGHL